MLFRSLGQSIEDCCTGSFGIKCAIDWLHSFDNRIHNVVRGLTRKQASIKGRIAAGRTCTTAKAFEHSIEHARARSGAAQSTTGIASAVITVAGIATETSLHVSTVA